MRVTGAPIKAALYLPRQALFEQDGEPHVVFVRPGRSFEPREVKVSHSTETHIVVTNLPVGTEVALRNPLSDEKTAGEAPDLCGQRQGHDEVRHRASGFAARAG